MDLLAIGLLGIAGKYISDRFTNQTNDEYIEDSLDEIPLTQSTIGFDQKERVQDSMRNVVKEKKILSNDPHNKNIIPTLYNKRVYDLDAENKYLSSVRGHKYDNTIGESMLDLYKSDKNLMEGPANELTTLNEQFSEMAINNNKPAPSNMGKLTLPDDWTPYNKNDDDMTYKIFNKDELIHNNMQPFFKDRGLLITQDNSIGISSGLDRFSPNGFILGHEYFFFAL